MSTQNQKVISSQIQEQSSIVPQVDQIQAALAGATDINSFFGKEGIFSKLFAKTIEQMLQAELENSLGYGKHEVKGYNSGNSRNGTYQRKLQTSAGEVALTVPRDRSGVFEPQILEKYQRRTNEIEDKILYLYAKGVSTQDIAETLKELYGIEVSKALISTITEKVMPLFQEWKVRPLESVYPIVYLDAIHIKVKIEGKVRNTAIYTCLGIDTSGDKSVLGQYVGQKGTYGESASFWLDCLTDLQNRGVKDVLIVCVDGLNGFTEAITAVFPNTIVQRCIIHQIRNTLKYVVWKEKDKMMLDLKLIYKAQTKEEAWNNLEKIEKKWGNKYRIALQSWRDNWEELTNYFDFTEGIRRMIYTTNAIESYNRQLRQVIKTKSSFPSIDATYKMLFLVTRNIEEKWERSKIAEWALILSQLAIKFEGRITTHI